MVISILQFPLFIFYLILLVLSPARSHTGALPEYEIAYNALINRSKAQGISLQMGVVQLPAMVNINPALSPWPWGAKDLMMVLWCPRKGEVIVFRK